jgi:hypothetical protein
VPVEEAAACFGVSREQLIHDVELAALCGLPPYVDEMIDLFVDDDVIYAGVPRLFTRPLRMTAREAFRSWPPGGLRSSCPAPIRADPWHAPSTRWPRDSAVRRCCASTSPLCPSSTRHATRSTGGAAWP